MIVQNLVPVFFSLNTGQSSAVAGDAPFVTATTPARKGGSGSTTLAMGYFRFFKSPGL